MSKSSTNEKSKISLNDDPKAAMKKIMSATTDSEGVIRFDMINQPGISNLMNIYSVLTGESIADIETSFTGKGYGDFKKELVGVVQESLAPIQERFNDIRYSDELITVLKDGAERANAIAVPVLARVKERFGLGL